MVRMIGAMPAVAVRQQRKNVKQDEHKHRPNTLTIDTGPGYTGLPTPLRSPRASPKTSPAASPAATPKQSPVTSPRAHSKPSSSKGCMHRCVHGYLCGRVSLLHVSVVCVLLGITLLVVGLVQLVPGAASDVNKYAIIGAGTGFLGLGFMLLIILCACQKNNHRRRRHPPHLLQHRDRNNGKRKSANIYAMDCVTPLAMAQAQQGHKTKGGRGGKGHNKGHARQMQAQTLDHGVGSSSQHHRHQQQQQQQQQQQDDEEQGGVLTDKDMSLEGFIKSPSESDALLQSCSAQH